jgi:hypothetical protein
VFWHSWKKVHYIIGFPSAYGVCVSFVLISMFQSRDLHLTQCLFMKLPTFFLFLAPFWKILTNTRFGGKIQKMALWLTCGAKLFSLKIVSYTLLQNSFMKQFVCKMWPTTCSHGFPRIIVHLGSKSFNVYMKNLPEWHLKVAYLHCLNRYQHLEIFSVWRTACYVEDDCLKSTKV